MIGTSTLQIIKSKDSEKHFFVSCHNLKELQNPMTFDYDADNNFLARKLDV